MFLDLHFFEFLPEFSGLAIKFVALNPMDVSFLDGLLEVFFPFEKNEGVVLSDSILPLLMDDSDLEQRPELFEVVLKVFFHEFSRDVLDVEFLLFFFEKLSSSLLFADGEFELNLEYERMGILLSPRYNENACCLQGR